MLLYFDYIIKGKQIIESKYRWPWLNFTPHERIFLQILFMFMKVSIKDKVLLQTSIEKSPPTHHVAMYLTIHVYYLNNLHY